MTERPGSKKKKIGKYAIEKQIGKGSAANIYLAKQDSLGRKLVIKELLPLYASNERIITRFEREAKLISQLSHDVIVHIYDYWVQNNSYYFTMEYIPGNHLRKILSKANYLPIHIAAIIIYQICRGLEHAHKNGVIHRDLKPANIMISNLGQVKILDFGVAHFQSEENVTALGAVIGTYNYMSPEQALGTKVTPSSDIFSMGILFYELLTGVKPFNKDENEDVLEKIVKRRARKVRKINPAVPKSFQKIITKCLRKKPKYRYQNFDKIKKKLERYLKKYSLDHQGILRKYIENIRPMKIDRNWPPNLRRRTWYHLTHMRPATVILIVLALAGITYSEYRLIISGVTPEMQWKTIRDQAVTQWERLKPQHDGKETPPATLSPEQPVPDRSQTPVKTDSVQTKPKKKKVQKTEPKQWRP